jgi:hypothetical protein
LWLLVGVAVLLVVEAPVVLGQAQGLLLRLVLPTQLLSVVAEQAVP